MDTFSALWAAINSITNRVDAIAEKAGNDTANLELAISTLTGRCSDITGLLQATEARHGRVEATLEALPGLLLAQMMTILHPTTKSVPSPGNHTYLSPPVTLRSDMSDIHSRAQVREVGS